MNKIKKIYKLSDIKYPQVLLFSMLVFISSFCVQKYYVISVKAETVTYSVGFAVALIWSILNYMDHFKLNAIYKKYDDINVFVNSMSMEKDERSELIQYLNDFAKDLEEKGETHGNAVKTAISHFQVQEFTESRGGEIFEKPTHYYLAGYISIFTCVFLAVNCFEIFFPVPFILSAVSFTFILYSVGFGGLFLLYKMIDVLITKEE